MRRQLATLIFGALLLSACGSDEGAELATATTAATAADTSDLSALSDNVCDDFSDGTFSAEFVDAVPAGHEDALALLESMSELDSLLDDVDPLAGADSLEDIDSLEGPPDFPAQEFFDVLGGPDVAAQFNAFAPVAAALCGDEAGQLIDGLASASTMMREPKDEEYCAFLNEDVSGSMSGDSSSSADPTLDDVESIIPESHFAAFRSIEDETIDPGTAFSFIGIGIYG
ncbi:MAG: hypothetical protein GX868_15555, partial [Actinobacteria bacterium]|nr:hypothetical protein [Actinomycetota bacterium]